MENVDNPPLPFCTSDYCNLVAKALGLDPAGHGREFNDAVLLETPLPWKRVMYEQAGVLPQEMIDLLGLWLARYRAGQSYNHLAMTIAPDAQYSQPGYRRVIYFSRRSGAIAHFDRAEYLVPEAEVGPLVWALYEAQAELPSFEPYRLPATAADGTQVRDLLVCTHGSVDVACAKFGYPIYRFLRDHYANEALRVWRVSHFGGHVFAPTLLEMPTGHYWAYVGEAQAHQIATRTGDVAQLRDHYRGWAGLASGFMQAAECEAWQREGWAWFDYAKSGAMISQELDTATPQWGQVQIDYRRPDGTTGSFVTQVEITTHIKTHHSTGKEQQSIYPQYAVTEPQLEHELIHELI